MYRGTALGDKVSGQSRPIEITSIALVLSQEGSAVISLQFGFVLLCFILLCFVLFCFACTQVHCAHTHAHAHNKPLTQLEAFFGSVENFSHTVPGHARPLERAAKYVKQCYYYCCLLLLFFTFNKQLMSLTAPFFII